MSNWADELLPRLAALGMDKRLPTLVALLLTIMLAQSMAVLTWDLLPQSQVNEALATTSAQPVAQVGTAGKNQVRQISQWHLFGVVQKTASKAAAQVTNAPDTRLNLKLRGVSASSDPALAYAIIADGKGKEDSYALESKLPGNAVLKEIYVDRVILEYRGRMEALRLPRDTIASVGSSPTARRGSGLRSRVNAIPSRSVRNAETSALLRQYREAMINDPQSLMNLVSASPVVDKSTGKLKGYRMRPGKDRKLLKKFGLKNGDVVMAVNGVSLDNPIKALEIMRDLSTASSVSLDVERRGQMQSFSFQID